VPVTVTLYVPAGVPVVPPPPPPPPPQATNTIASATAAKENPNASRRLGEAQLIPITRAKNAARNPAAVASGSSGSRGERGAAGTSELAVVEIVNIPGVAGVAEPALQLVFVGSEPVHESATVPENPPIALIGTV
jgi:hypothetical protein